MREYVTKLPGAQVRLRSPVPPRRAAAGAAQVRRRRTGVRQGRTAIRRSSCAPSSRRCSATSSCCKALDARSGAAQRARPAEGHRRRSGSTSPRRRPSYEKRGAKTDQVPLTQMRAKVAVMNAVYATLQPEPNDQAVLDALAGFEKKYPDQQELLPQVARLRLSAEQHLGRFGDADAEVQAHGPAPARRRSARRRSKISPSASCAKARGARARKAPPRTRPRSTWRCSCTSCWCRTATASSKAQADAGTPLREHRSAEEGRRPLRRDSARQQRLAGGAARPRPHRGSARSACPTRSATGSSSPRRMRGGDVGWYEGQLPGGAADAGHGQEAGVVRPARAAQAGHARPERRRSAQAARRAVPASLPVSQNRPGAEVLLLGTRTVRPAPCDEQRQRGATVSHAKTSP